jgi:hypothetical protein
MKTLLVSEDAVDVDDGALLLLGEGAALQVRPEVVDPPEPAALAAPLQPCRRPPWPGYEQKICFLIKDEGGIDGWISSPYRRALGRRSSSCGHGR